MQANQASHASNVTQPRNHCLHGTSLTDALSLAADLAQWEEDVMGGPAPLSAAVAVTFDIYLRDQTGTRGPLDITLEQLREDGHDISPAVWNEVRPAFLTLAAEWADNPYLDAPGIGPVVAVDGGAA